MTRAGVRSGLQTLGCLTVQEFDSSSGAIFFLSHVVTFAICHLLAISTSLDAIPEILNDKRLMLSSNLAH